jgi:hypothetical protein
MLWHLRRMLDTDPQALPYRHFRGPPSVSSAASGPRDAGLGRAWLAARAGDAEAYNLSDIAAPQPVRVNLRPPEIAAHSRSASSAAGAGLLPDIAVQSPSESSAGGPGSVALRSEHTSDVSSRAASMAMTRSAASRMSGRPLLDGSHRGLLSALNSSAAASSPRSSQWGGSPARSVPAEAPNVRASSRASDIFDRFWRNLSREPSQRSSRGRNSGLATRNSSRATSTSDVSANSPRRQHRRGLSHQINPVAFRLLQNFLRDSRDAAAAAASEGPTSGADLHGVEWPLPEDAG